MRTLLFGAFSHHLAVDFADDHSQRAKPRGMGGASVFIHSCLAMRLPPGAVLSFVWAKSGGEVRSEKPVTISQKTN